MRKQLNRYTDFSKVFLSLFFILCLFLSSSSIEKQVEITKDGQALVKIVISSSASKEVEFAAKELQHYIGQISGARIEIATDKLPIRGKSIFVGRCKGNVSYLRDNKMLSAEAFHIVTKDGNLLLDARNEHGIAFAVYSFLEEYLDVHWLWPGELGEVVPGKKTLIIPGIDKVEEPDFHWRSRMITDDGVEDEVLLWEKRNRWGGFKVYGGHSLSEVFPPAIYAKTHPEFYALVGGVRDVPTADYDNKHGCQVCTTNPEVIRIAAEWANNFFEKHPEYDAVNMSMNDGGGLGYCQCERCRALDDGRRIEKPLDSDESLSKDSVKNIVITDRIFTYINKIAEQVTKKHPGKYVMCYAYSQYKRPPKNVVLRDNVIPQYTQWSAYRHANDELKQQHQRIIKGWTSAAHNTAIYEYYINGSWPSLPRIAPSLYADNIKELYREGVKLYYTQAGTDFAVNGTNYYVAGKLLWNSNFDENEILESYYMEGFGAAAEYIKQYFKRLENGWLEATKDGRDINAGTLADTRILELYTPQLLKECTSDLDKASNIANSDIIRKRVAFIRTGFEYTVLTVKATTLAKELLSLGVPLFNKDKRKQEVNYSAGNSNERSPNKLKEEQLIRQALEAWKERDLFVQAHKNDYAISYYWIKYNDKNRYFNPHSALEELVRSDKKSQ
jgi:hypothetical protein